MATAFQYSLRDRAGKLVSVCRDTTSSPAAPATSSFPEPFGMSRTASRTGESLAKRLNQHPVFPPMVVKMMAVGEDTGALDTMLKKISNFYDQEVEATTESLTALIEPLMIAFLGTVIGAMIIALYMPIFKVFDMIK